MRTKEYINRKYSLKAAMNAFGILVLFCFILSANSMYSQSENQKIILLHTNDFHGQYMPFEVAPGNATSQTGDPGGTDDFDFEHGGKVGGFAVLAGVVDSIRNERGEDKVILVHAGDTYSDDLLGNITKGEAMIKLMNALGYQFLSLGNHDFDYTWERTKELQQMADFPIRAANILEKKNRKPVLGSPVKIIEANGVKIALLALGYHNTPNTTNPDNVKELTFLNGPEVAEKYIDELQEEVDAVIVLSHQGTEVDELLLQKTDGIDVIIGGHSHDEISREGDAKIVQSLADAAVLGEVELIFENGNLKEVNSKNHVLWNDKYKPQQQTENLINELRKPYLDTLEQVIGVARERIGRNYMSESPFDKLVGEILRSRENAQIAMLPGVGYGITLTEGEITREQLYTLIPHSSKIVRLDLTGNQIKQILEQSAKNIAPEDPLDIVGGLIQTSGLEWTVDFTKKPGSRISNVRINGREIEDDELYSVVTHSGMLAGTHKYNTFAEGKNIQKKDVQLNQAVIEAFGGMQEIKAPETQDVTMIGK